MNRMLAITLFIAATGATSAFAGTAMQGDIATEAAPAVAARARADVQAELAQYKKVGINPWAMGYNPLKYMQSAKSRAEVQQEYLASRDEVRGMTGEDSGSSYLAQHRAIPSGTQVAGRAAAQE